VKMINRHLVLLDRQLELTIKPVKFKFIN